MKKTSPEIAVLVSTFERPQNLRRVLASIAAQRGLGGAWEVVVTDDGSRDETPRLVQQFAASVGFPVRFTTHAHDGFQLSRSRNEGVAASTAPYLLFLDGDCLIPPDHLRIHLDRRRQGCAMAGYYVWLDRATSERVSEADARTGVYQKWASSSQRWQMRWRHLQASFYSLLRDPNRPKLLGGNLGISRDDYERVNGYDENFHGWGCEDDDLRLRLRSAGVGVESISWWTQTYHLWHPKTPSAPATWRNGANVDYLNRPVRLRKCLSGMVKRRLQDLDVRCVGRLPTREVQEVVLPLWCRVALAADKPQALPAEMELAVAPSSGAFSKGCDCRVLVVPRGAMPAQQLVREADFIFADRDLGGSKERCFSLSALDAILRRQLGAAEAPRSAPRRELQPA